MIRFLLLIVSISVFSNVANAQDLVEFTSGVTMSGKIVAIRKDAKEFEFQTKIGNREISKTYPYASVHAVTLKGKRFVITPKQSAGETNDAGSNGTVQRTQEEVEALIRDAGSRPPDWLAETAMNHPPTLDLDWPLKAEGKWNESKNVGQYIWGRVNPNVARWKPGIKLVHECLERHANDPALAQRDMQKLGDMYFTLLQDYARAAYWLQKANVSPGRPAGVYLAECYWRLGNRAMAKSQLKSRQVHFDAIKLYGDMGEIEAALRLTEVYRNSGLFNEAFLNAGDALRSAGRLDEAVEFYQAILDRDSARNAEYKKRYHARARGAIEAIKLYDRADVRKVADGTYKDFSTAYNGRLEVELTVSGNKITEVRVTKHREKQFYAAISDTTSQIIETQGIIDIDGTSGATITSQAIIHASARALAQGAR